MLCCELCELLERILAQRSVSKDVVRCPAAGALAGGRGSASTSAGGLYLSISIVMLSLSVKGSFFKLTRKTEKMQLCKYQG